MRKITSCVLLLVISVLLFLGGCGNSSSSDSTPAPNVNPNGNWVLTFSNRSIGNALGACAVAPTSPANVTIVENQNNTFTWTEDSLTPSGGTLNCNANNCTITTVQQGAVYTYTYNVAITTGMTGTMLQHGPACDDTYTVTGTKQ